MWKPTPVRSWRGGRAHVSGSERWRRPGASRSRWVRFVVCIPFVHGGKAGTEARSPCFCSLISDLRIPPAKGIFLPPHPNTGRSAVSFSRSVLFFPCLRITRKFLGMLRAAIPTAMLPVPRDASFCPGLPGGLWQSWDHQEGDADSGLRLPKLLRWAGKAFGEELNQHSPAGAPPGELLGLNFLPNPKFIRARMLLMVGWARRSRGTPRIHTRDPPWG